MMMSKRLFAKVALTGVGAALVARAAQALDRAPLKDSVAVPETIDPAKLSNAWDKVFPEDPRVSHRKVVFHNRFGITLVGDLYTPKTMKAGEKMRAIALAGRLWRCEGAGVGALRSGARGPRISDAGI